MIFNNQSLGLFFIRARAFVFEAVPASFTASAFRSAFFFGSQTWIALDRYSTTATGRICWLHCPLGMCRPVISCNHVLTALHLLFLLRNTFYKTSFYYVSQGQCSNLEVLEKQLFPLGCWCGALLAISCSRRLNHIIIKLFKKIQYTLFTLY